MGMFRWTKNAKYPNFFDVTSNLNININRFTQCKYKLKPTIGSVHTHFHTDFHTDFHTFCDSNARQLHLLTRNEPMLCSRCHLSSSPFSLD